MTSRGRALVGLAMLAVVVFVVSLVARLWLTSVAMVLLLIVQSGNLRATWRGRRRREPGR